MIHLVLDDELCFILRWTNTAPLPCGSCAPSFVSLGSVLVLVVRVRLRCVPHLSVLCSGSWSCLGHPQPPCVPGTGVLWCKQGPTRVLPMPRQYGIGRRAPALRTLATSYDFKETWFIDVSSCRVFGKIFQVFDIFLGGFWGVFGFLWFCRFFMFWSL